MPGVCHSDTFRASSKKGESKRREFLLNLRSYMLSEEWRLVEGLPNKRKPENPR